MLLVFVNFYDTFNYLSVTYNFHYVTVHNFVIFNTNIVQLFKVVKYCKRTHSDIGKVQLSALIQWQGWGFSSPLLVAIFAPTLNVRFWNILPLVSQFCESIYFNY